MPPVLDCGGKQTNHASLVIRETHINMSTPKNVDHFGQFSNLQDGTIANMLNHCDNLPRVSLAHKEHTILDF